MTTANKNKIEERKKRVLEEKLKEPTIDQRDLAKKVGSSAATVNRDLARLKQDETLADIPAINAIKDADLELVVLGQSGMLDWGKEVIRK